LTLVIFVVCSTSCPLHWLIDPDAKARSVHWKPKDMRNISSSFSAVAQETWSRRVLHTFARGCWCCLIGMALVLQWRVLWRKWTLNMSLVGTESNKAVLILADLIASIFSREWLVVMRIRSEQSKVMLSESWLNESTSKCRGQHPLLICFCVDNGEEELFVH
jgi:uncharacterized membrane protein YcjF (UPF0283 family)